MLPEGWRCEVIPRKCQLPVRGQDVVFYSPIGEDFRSTVDVYKHLRLDASLTQRLQETKRSSSRGVDSMFSPSSTNHAHSDSCLHSDLLTNLNAG